MSRASPARLARRHLATDEVDRVHRAAVAHANALHNLLMAVAALPRPAHVTEQEHAAYREQIVQSAEDVGDVLRLMHETIGEYIKASGLS